MSAIKENILITLAYFDLFNYPLTRSETGIFLRNRYNQHEFIQAFKCLVEEGTVYQFDQFYTLKNDPSLITRRRAGNRKAAELIEAAGKIGNFLIRFPYVRGIAISGSLSKNYADNNSDIDLFIITTANRLWIARTIMHAFKKLTFLVNKQHYFCMNYYIDEQQLEIVEKTFYTAMEVVTLMPLQGDQVFEQFYMANTWTRQFFPNKVMRLSSAKPIRHSSFKAFIEKIFDNKAGNAIDNILMRITAKRWSAKAFSGKKNAKGAIMAMAVNKHCSKPDPRNFQNKLLKQFELSVSGILRDTPNRIAH